jgi:hypothetical protein
MAIAATPSTATTELRRAAGRQHRDGGTDRSADLSDAGHRFVTPRETDRVVEHPETERRGERAVVRRASALRARAVVEDAADADGSEHGSERPGTSVARAPWNGA